PDVELGHFLVDVETARDELGLPPDDPAGEMLLALGATDATDATDATVANAAAEESEESEDSELMRQPDVAAALRVQLEDTTRRLAELERQVAEQKREPAPTAPSARTDVPGDAEQARAKQRRIEALEGKIREDNAERAELRRRLAEAEARSSLPV